MPLPVQARAAQRCHWQFLVGLGAIGVASVSQLSAADPPKSYLRYSFELVGGATHDGDHNT